MPIPVSLLGSSYQLVVGPLLIGVVVNALVFGICVMQLIAYFLSEFKDNWWILGMLCWIYAIDTFQVCTSVSMLWHYTVTNFANPISLAFAPWEYATVPVFSSIAPVPIHFFMAYRIMRFSRSKLLFVYIAALSLGQAVLACAGAAQGLTHTTIQSHIMLVPTEVAWIILSILCDLSISGLLLYYLSRSRTGFERTDSIISRICTTIIKASVPGTILCILDLCFLMTMPDNNLHYMFLLPVGRLYTNTVLCTLNERRRLRSHLENLTSNQQGINLATIASSRRHLQRNTMHAHSDVDETLDQNGPLDLESILTGLRMMKAGDGFVDIKLGPREGSLEDQYVTVNALLRGNGCRTQSTGSTEVGGEEAESVQVRFEHGSSVTCGDKVSTGEGVGTDD
ncbi:uncharacterized protein FOMMEDRAFT_142771 [Fomitiporia mediterranea MF3/22]|uniref:uncharacterized protein n=1 Tax=Fomitiporia mediterranea (strain MF3/22) TaxID=694068 RepID=UPI00044084DC|nr:uncharacterized protein FOMMEDRAFT_142771 [Fomitiporia mediterranea MF3/22]EJC99557.1 hypothetical protein FOMMEDRAFT_142771 [Fomitiporia mediterranea MF3/22]